MDDDDDDDDDGNLPFSQRCKFRVGSYSYDSSKMVFITKVLLMIMIMMLMITMMIMVMTFPMKELYGFGSIQILDFEIFVLVISTTYVLSFLHRITLIKQAYGYASKKSNSIALDYEISKFINKNCYCKILLLFNAKRILYPQSDSRYG